MAQHHKHYLCVCVALSLGRGFRIPPGVPGLFETAADASEAVGGYGSWRVDADIGRLDADAGVVSRLPPPVAGWRGSDGAGWPRKVGRAAQVDPGLTALARFQLRCDNPLSRFASNFNLIRYKKVLCAAGVSRRGAGEQVERRERVGACVSECSKCSKCSKCRP